MTALHYLSRALHAYPSNAKAAELARDLLCGKAWCAPITRALQSESESPLLSATFGPEGQVFAVSSDGNFLSWNGDGSSLVRRQALLSEESPSTGDNFAPNKAMNLAAACFSDDAEWLLVISPPAPSGTTARAQVWNWSPQSASYECKCPSIQITDPAHYYSIVRSSNGSLLVVISRRDNPSIRYSSTTLEVTTICKLHLDLEKSRRLASALTINCLPPCRPKERSGCGMLPL